MKDKITRFSTSGFQRWKNRLGKFAAPCIVTERWLRFAKMSVSVGDEEVVWVDVMTGGHGNNPRKLTTLFVERRQLEEVLRRVRPNP